MPDFWAWRPFSVGVRSHKAAVGDTKKVLARAQKMRAASPLASYDDVAFANDVITKALGDDEVYPSSTVLHALYDLLADVYHNEALSVMGNDVLSARPNSLDEIATREYLRCQIRFLEDYESNMRELITYMANVCRYLMLQIPIHALEGDPKDAFLTAPYINMAKDIPSMIEMLGGSAFDDDLVARNLMESWRRRYEVNVMMVSKIDPRMPPANRHRYLQPTQNDKLSYEEMVEQYLIGTALRAFFKTELPVSVNEQARYEHSHILAGTGHGKTQFIQKWLLHDLEKVTTEKRSIVVIDSQGDLIRKIAQLDYFHPETGALKDKLIIIDPTDVLYPPAINMFAVDEVRFASYGPAEREKVQNSAIALYEHFFGELLGAELTAKQGVVFKYLARLMLNIPDATILTLRDLVDDPMPFIPYMEELEGSARVFFAREFLDKSFNQTRKQISKRLWGVLSTPAFERLFSSTDSKIDLFSAMNEGKVILINTAKDLLKEDGASLYGRFFISMIGQAIMERATIPESKRTPTFLYIDECQDYFDKTVELLLVQGRKYRLGLTLSHQVLSQLPPRGRDTILANTSIKAVGGINAKDAKTFASEMQVSSDYLQSMKKTRWHSEFAFWMKHDLDDTLTVKVQFGQMERHPRMESAAFKTVLEKNREQHCWYYTPQKSTLEVQFPGRKPKPKPVVEKPKEETPTPPPMLIEKEAELELETEEAQTGRGGEMHVTLQNTVRSLAQSYGWLAHMEHQVKDGAVDLWLERGDLSIACEITVTTPVSYELKNIEKCKKAGADEVWMIGEDTEKLQQIRKGLSDRRDVYFLTPDDIPREIEARSDMAPSETSEVRGYTVAIKRAYVSETEMKVRQQRLQQLLRNKR